MVALTSQMVPSCLVTRENLCCTTIAGCVTSVIHQRHAYVGHRKKRQCVRAVMAQSSATGDGRSMKGSSGPDTVEMSPQEEQVAKDQAARMQALYDRETPILDQILEEIDKLGFAEREIEKITGEGPTLAEKKESIREAVDNHFDEMSEGLLMVIAGYAQAAYGNGHNSLGETLELLRDEILQRTVAQLPAELQVLEMMTTMVKDSKSERIERLCQIHNEGYGDLPATPLSSVRTMTTQMLEDIEDKLDIIDRTLLARLCIVREDVDDAAESLGLVSLGSEYMNLIETTWRLLPEGNAAFLSNLMQTGNADKRRAVLQQCIRDDFQNNPKDKLAQLWRAQGVRPGRLLNTIAAVVNGLNNQPGPATDERKVKEAARLAEIKNEALSLLSDLIDPGPM